MSFRFVHTADIHLDSPLKTLALKDAKLAEIAGNATRQAFVNIISLCLVEKVDALLIAGDLYDGQLKSMKTAAFLVAQLERLTKAGIRAFIIRGNHDAESRITRHLSLPDGVHVFSGRGETVELKQAGVAIHGISFAKPRAPESLVVKLKPPVSGVFNIGMLHTSLSGDSAHDVYSPCTVQNLIDQGYDYWALGHIHKRAVHGNSACTIVMPGIPQGRHINEAGPRTVSLVEAGDDRPVRITEHNVAVVRFERLRVDISGIDDWDRLLALIERKFEAAIENCGSGQMIVRLECCGAAPIATRLRRDLDIFTDEARLRAANAGPLFIEQIDVSARMPELEVKSGQLNPLMEIRRLASRGDSTPRAVEGDVLALLQDLQKSLPPVLRDGFGADEAAMNRLVSRLLDEGVEDVLAQLQTGMEVE